MSGQTWRLVVGTALVIAALLLVLTAVALSMASQLSTGQGDGNLLLWLVLPLSAGLGSMAAGIGLLRQARPGRWARFLALGWAIAVVVVLAFVSLLSAPA